MTDLDPRDPQQLHTWAGSLARTRREQIRIIRDLLIHANTDKMTELDRVFCRAALQMLEQERAA